MGHLNELSDTYESRGLTVLGLTSESSSQTEPWIEKHGARYPYAYDKGDKLKNWLGLGGWPSAALVDPYGNVVWKGHPGGLTSDIVEKHLDGAFTTPLWEWPKEASGVKKAIQKRDFGKALLEAQELEGEQGATIAKTLRGMVDSRMATLDSRYEAGDFLGAYELAERLGDELKGLDEEVAKADAVYDKIKSDKAAKDVMKAQEEVRELEEEIQEIRRADDGLELIEEFEELAEENADNYAGKQAREAIDRIREMLG